MATYAELITASNNTALVSKIHVACFIAAETVRTEAPATANHANRLLWARQVFIDPGVEARRMALYDFATKQWTVLAQGDGWGNTGLLLSSGKLLLMGGGINGPADINKQVWVGTFGG